MKNWLVIAIAMLFAPVSAQAVKVVGLYQVAVPVSSQLSEDRSVGVRTGFSQLLIKLTGNPAIEKNPALKEATQRADYYIKDFSYSAPTMSSSMYTLHVSFEPDDVNRLLQKSGVAFWGQKRPLVLVWLAVTNENKTTEIIGSETPGDISDALYSQSKRFGLPVILPMMDVADMSQVSVSEVSNRSLPALRAAGKRYSPNAYLIGKIEKVEGGYQSQWQLVMNNNQWSWSIKDKTTEDIISEVFYQASQTFLGLM